MRGIFFLIIVIAVLIGAGIIHITWKDGAATVTFDKEKAHQRTEQLMEEARTLEQNFEKGASQKK